MPSRHFAQSRVGYHSHPGSRFWLCCRLSARCFQLQWWAVLHSWLQNQETWVFWQWVVLFWFPRRKERRWWCCNYFKNIPIHLGWSLCCWAHLLLQILHQLASLPDWSGSMRIKLNTFTGFQSSNKQNERNYEKLEIWELSLRLPFACYSLSWGMESLPAKHFLNPALSASTTITLLQATSIFLSLDFSALPSILNQINHGAIIVPHRIAQCFPLSCNDKA